MLKIQTISHNTRLHLLLFAISLLLILIPYVNKTPSQQVSEKSLLAAAQFLFLVDTEEYAKSWEVASDTLKKMLPQQTWNKQITQIRAFLGPVVERTQSDIFYTDAALDAPPGEYVVMTFISKFELRERTTETITLLLDDNDQWQVAGYFLK